MSIPMKSGDLVNVKKKKLKVISVSKNEKIEIWTFEKSQSFIPSLLQFLLDLGFTLEKDFDLKFFFGVPHEDDEYMSDSYIKDPFSQKYLPISLFDQEIITFRKKSLDIEAIFFANHTVLSIRTNKKSSEIGKLISKFALFRNETN